MRVVGIVGIPTRAVATGPNIDASNDGREFSEADLATSRWQKTAHVEIAVVRAAACRERRFIHLPGSRVAHSFPPDSSALRGDMRSVDRASAW